MTELDAAYRRLFPMVRAKCVRVLGRGEEAEEVAQDTFLRLWREGLADAPVAVVTAWVYRTGTRLAIDRLRRRDVAIRLAPVPSEEGGPSPEHHVRVGELVRRVPERVLEVGLLHRVDGLTQPEIAEVLGLSERTVRRLLTELDAALSEER